MYLKSVKLSYKRNAPYTSNASVKRLLYFYSKNIVEITNVQESEGYKEYMYHDN